MIKKPSNWETAKVYGSGMNKIPAGAYVCIIKQVGITTNTYGQTLNVLFDIEDGDYAGYYAKKFDNDKSSNYDDVKWKGNLRVTLPGDLDEDDRNTSKFKTFINAVEESNAGYHAFGANGNMDEKYLVGKMVGILLQNKEWAINGKTGWTAQPYGAISVSDVQDGNYQIPPDKPLKTATLTEETDSSSNGTNPFTHEDENELPF